MSDPVRNLYRDREDFDATVDAAAEHLDISAVAVEKDFQLAAVGAHAVPPWMRPCSS